MTGNLRNRLISFSDHGIELEHYFILCSLEVICSNIQDHSHEYDTFWGPVTRVLEVCEAWDIYHGFSTESQPGHLSPLQIQVPPWYGHEHLSTAPASFKSRWGRRTLRLLYLDPKQRVVISLQTYIEPRLKVTACYNISERCSNEIGEVVVDSQPPFVGFAEPMSQERCMQLILGDIWDDPDQELDACMATPVCPSICQKMVQIFLGSERREMRVRYICIA